MSMHSCSGLQKPVLNTDSSDSDSFSYFDLKPSAKKCYAWELYSYSSDDDNIEQLNNKGETTPKKHLKLNS